MFSPEEIEKLPKWAQTKVRVLTQTLTEKSALLGAMQGEKTGLRVEGLRAETYLPERSRLIFEMLDGSIEFHRGTDCVEVYSRSSSGLLVMPQSSNHVQVRPQAR